MAQSRAKSTWEITNYRRFINQFQLNIIRSIRQFERINKKQKMSIIFNQICINEEMLPIYIYIYIYSFLYLSDKVNSSDSLNKDIFNRTGKGRGSPMGQ